MNSENWFSQSLFNLIVDYYTEISCRPYGSGATRENVLPVLKEIQPGFILIYAKGHSGRTTFKSSLKTEHAMLAKDMPAFFREVTRETGTKLFLYYSGLVDGIAGIRNPDWRMKKKDGELMTLFDEMYQAHPVCPLSSYFDEWLSVHFREMIERYSPDGIWVDGDWPGPCYCPRCEARYRKETGFSGPMPDLFGVADDTGTIEEKTAWNKTWAGITGEWRKKLRSLVKLLKPDCLYSSGNVNPRKEYSETFDWRSGDWFSPNNHRLMQSISMRKYTTHGIPYDAMTCDTSYVHAWREMRSRPKPLARMLQEGAGVLANGGQWCYWTYPMPNGAFIPSKMEKAKRAKEFAEARRDVCIGNESVKWTAVLDTNPNPQLWDGRICGSAKALIAQHKSPDIIDDSDRIIDHLPYELIVLPGQDTITPEIAGRLEKFVIEGGKLISSGNSIILPEMQKLAGVKLLKRATLNDGHVLLKKGQPDKGVTSAGVFDSWDRMEIVDGQELYPLYRSWDDSNPEMKDVPANYPMTGLLDEENPEKAGFPAVTVRKLGKGTVVHIATDFFSVYWKYGYPDMLALFKEILDTVQPDPFFRTDALSFVEIALRRKNNDLLVHFVNGNPGRDLCNMSTTDLWVDDIPAVGPINVEVKCLKKNINIRWEPGGKSISAVIKNNALTTTLERLEIHSCLVVEDYF